MDPCPVLVGRQEEMAALRRLLDAGGGVAVVSGEAGIGKSRLVREFAAESAQRGRTVLWGRPEEVAQPGPYALIADLLESIVERGGPRIKTDARALEASLLRSPSRDDLAEVPSSRSVAAEIRGLLSQLDTSPLTIFEDLHWADDASHSVLLHLGRAARDDGHLILASTRTEGAISEVSLSRLLDLLVRDRIAISVPLVPLTDEDVRTMLEFLLGRAPGTEELSVLGRLGEGIPFFIEELAAASSSDTADLVPRNVEHSVLSRLTTLDQSAKHVVRVGSLLAGVLDVRVLARACDLDQEVVERSLASATRTGLLTDDGGRLLFRHALVRQAVASSQLSVESAAIHRRLAEAIEHVHSRDLDQFSTALAEHYRQAGEKEAAISFALRAGHRALALAAIDESRAAFQLAVTLSSEESTEALLGLAEVEFREAREEQAQRLLRRAADQLRARGDLTAAATTLGRLAWVLQGRVASDEIIRLLDEALLLVENEHSSEFAKLLVQKGVMLTFAVTPAPEAEAILKRAEALALDLDDFSLAAESLDGLAYIAESRGAWSESIELGRGAIEYAAKSASAEIIGRVHNNHALLLAHHGSPMEGIEVLAEGRVSLMRSHGRAAVAALDVTHAWVSMLMGRPDEVARLTSAGQAAWHRWRGYRLLLEVWAAVEHGDLGFASSLVKSAWRDSGGEDARDAFLSGASDLRGIDASQLLRADLLENLGRDLPVEAVRAGERLLVIDRAGSERIDLSHTLAHLARAYLITNQTEVAIERLDELSAVLRLHPYPYMKAMHSELSGLVAQRQDRLDEARQFLADAGSRFRSCANEGDQARCVREIVELDLYAGIGNRETSAEVLSTARKLCEQAGSVSEMNRLESVMRSMGMRPRAGRKRRDDRLAIGGLSPREAEVVALVAAGSSNADIAGRLFLSERTIQDHITHALRKLGLVGRAALASWAVKHGML